MAKRRNIILILFAVIALASVAYLTWVKRPYQILIFPDGGNTVPKVQHDIESKQPSPLVIWIPAFTAIMSIIGTVSTILLSWRSDRRSAKESKLKIAQLERELAEAKESPENPKTKKPNKKVR